MLGQHQQNTADTQAPGQVCLPDSRYLCCRASSFLTQRRWAWWPRSSGAGELPSHGQHLGSSLTCDSSLTPQLLLGIPQLLLSAGPLQRHAAPLLSASRRHMAHRNLDLMVTDQMAHLPCRGLLLTKHDKADEDAADGILWSAAAFYKIHSASLGLSAGKQPPRILPEAHCFDTSMGYMLESCLAEPALYAAPHWPGVGPRGPAGEPHFNVRS